MLLLPFRIESELLSNFTCAKDAFTAKHALLDHSMHMHNSFLLQVENSIRRIRLAEAELQEQPLISSQNAVHIDFGVNAVCRPSTLEHIDNDRDTFHYLHMTACQMDISEFQKSTMSLTNCQKHALNIIQTHFHAAENNTALRLFVTGGGGVGKSFLLKMVVSYLQLFTSRMSGVVPVKCCCPTGTAA